ncbi:MAG: UDP-N-acetylmuramate--L-alanine ligase [Cyclobacteriaceae bacterium]|nr:UDP-N-acetylmuramate--L-alanine ligase [Cyclobacteriaceae bacterium]
MRFNDYHSIYFLGIGGIGMSALARWFKHKGLRVAGYDRTPTPLTHELMEEGMEIHFEDKVEFIPGYITKEKTLIVLTPAIPANHLELNYLRDQGFTILKRSEVLGLITRDYRTVAVAGTHGKTTTTSMIAHILKSAGVNMVGFLGGITANYDSNLVMHGEVSKDTIVVVEADEFDRSFLRLFPDVAAVTSADADHLDIYGDHASMVTSYQDFMKQVRPGGKLFVNEKINALAAHGDQVSVQTYGLQSGSIHAANVLADHGFFQFETVTPSGSLGTTTLGIPGFHNVENALAAAAIAREVGIDTKTIQEALKTFRGVKRRFEFIYKGAKAVYIDDYAHHPAEIEAFLTSLRAMYKGRKLTVVFQPHLYTRTRDFAAGFAKSLSIADELVMMDIYPARELPIEGVTSDIIFRDVTSPVKIRTSKKDLLHKLEALDLDVVATVGAGDIDTFVKPIKEMLTRRYEA